MFPLIDYILLFFRIQNNHFPSDATTSQNHILIYTFQKEASFVKNSPLNKFKFSQPVQIRVKAQNGINTKDYLVKTEVSG